MNRITRISILVVLDGIFLYSVIVNVVETSQLNPEQWRVLEEFIDGLSEADKGRFILE